MTRIPARLAFLILPVLCFAADKEDPKASDTDSNVHVTPGPAATQELFDELAREDSIFFEAFFITCDFDKVGARVTEDFEFYHDKGGLTATTGKQFVESLRNTCQRQKQGVDFRARRELVKGSMAVYPLTNYGAIQTGMHRFYAIAPGKPDRLTEVARFTIVWKKDDGVWRMSRALSYDHKLAE